MTSRAVQSYIKYTIALLACCIVAGVAQAADSSYPSRPIRFVVPFAPGGGADATARIFAPRLSEAMGQNWIVDNRTGAGGNLASELVARANPDGYTVLLVLDTMLTANPSLYDMSFNVETDLQPIVILAATDQIIVVHPDVPAKTLQEFVALAKQKPGQLRHGSGGVGSSNHLAAELFKKVSGIDVVHVPYKGAGPSLTALLAGEIQMNISSPASSLAYIKAGRLRALARTGTKRSKSMPELPTVAESGYPGFKVLQWYGLAVPGATPKRIVERIHEASLEALKKPEVLAAMDRLGFEPEPSTIAGLAARIKKETAMWAGIIKDAGIRLQ
ncbi:MAG: tripartite tricarboxylate transporter substrate binding protein [Betaproteobacteria bacterium]|nr:tripartite tricarboxylate transporter substrate binding protein [Betaproteobacteria bacterium]